MMWTTKRIGESVGGDIAVDNALQATFDAYKGQVAGIKTYVNADASDEAKPIPNGVVIVHDTDSPARADSLVNTEHLMIFPLPAKKSNGTRYTDADFTSDAIRARLQEAVPQYSTRPPSLSLRNPLNNHDTDTWEHELGQERAFAGICKRLEPNGRDYRYEIHVMAGAENVTQEMRTWLNQQPVDAPITWGQLVDSPEFAYANAIAEANAKRIGYAVARACYVPVSGLVDTASFPAESRASYAEPATMQPLSLVERTPAMHQIAVYSGVTPARYCNDAMVATIGNAYDSTTVYKMENVSDALGVPVVAARVPAANMDALSAEEAKERVSHMIWEGKLPQNFHPDAHPQAFEPISDSVMENHGWNRKSHFERAIPVLLKVSNPQLKR